jgi:hypothetical protein
MHNTYNNTDTTSPILSTVYVSCPSMSKVAWIFLASFALFLNLLQAQTPAVVATTTDESFASTTVIYKTKSATDSEILTALEGDFGMSDVVRIAVAPPKPKVEASKMSTKPMATVISTTTTVSAQPVVVPKAVVKPASPVVTNVTVNKNTAPTPTVAGKATAPVTKPVTPVKVVPMTTASTTAKPVVTNNITPMVRNTATIKVSAPAPTAKAVAPALASNQTKMAVPIAAQTAKAAPRTTTKTVKTNTAAKKRTTQKWSLFGSKQPKNKHKGNQKYHCYKF